MKGGRQHCLGWHFLLDGSSAGVPGVLLCADVVVLCPVAFYSRLHRQALICSIEALTQSFLACPPRL